MREKIKKMSMRKREILATAISLLFVFLFYVGVLYSTKFTDIIFGHEAVSEISAVNNFMVNKESSLLSVARAVSANTNIINAVKNEDYVGAPVLAKQLVQDNKIDALGIFDKFGMVLTRGIQLDRTGDYVFQSTETGRELLKGNEVVGIREAITSPLAITAGKRVLENGNFIGAVNASYFINDSFAEGLKNILGIDIAFFDNQSGVVASSFANSQIEKSLNNYFELNVLTKQKVIPNGYIVIGGKTYFAFENLFTDPGLSGDGYIVFVQENNIQIYVLWSVITSLLLLIIFLLLHDIRLFAPTQSMENRSALILGVIFTIVVTFPITLILTSFYIGNHYADISKASQTLYNSTLSLNPSSGVFTRGVEQRIGVVITTGGETINAFDIGLSLDPKLADIADIDTSDSFCSKGFLIEKQIDKLNGDVHISCVVVNPGFSGGPINAFTLVVTPKADSFMNILFSATSSVLANDGLGTDVLRQAVGGSYQTVASIEKNGVPVSFVFSPTDPDPAQWYNSNSADILWQSPNAKSFAYSVDQSSSTPFSTDKATTTSSEMIVGLDNGLNYFHLWPLDSIGKPIDAITYPMQIDTTPPSIPTIELSGDTIKTNEILRITFSSDDGQSGLQKNFYVSYDNGIFLPTTSPINTVFSDTGTHSITIRTYDNAGNFSDKTVSVEVQ